MGFQIHLCCPHKMIMSAIMHRMLRVQILGVGWHRVQDVHNFDVICWSKIPKLMYLHDGRKYGLGMLHASHGGSFGHKLIAHTIYLRQQVTNMGCHSLLQVHHRCLNRLLCLCTQSFLLHLMNFDCLRTNCKCSSKAMHQCAQGAQFSVTVVNVTPIMLHVMEPLCKFILRIIPSGHDAVFPWWKHNQESSTSSSL